MSGKPPEDQAERDRFVLGVCCLSIQDIWADRGGRKTLESLARAYGGSRRVTREEIRDMLTRRIPEFLAAHVGKAENTGEGERP